MAAQSENSELLIYPPLQATRNTEGALVLTRKFLDGVREYARWWPGRVTVLVETSDVPDTNLDHVVVSPNLPFDVEIAPDDPRALAARLRIADVVLSSNLHVPLDVCNVFVAETTLHTRLQIARAETSNPIKCLWRMSVQLKNESKIRKLIKAAAGVQCNGTPTYDAYSRCNKNTMLFFDTRTTESMLIRESALEARLASLAQGRPLKLAFSGRLTAIKGVLELPPVAAALRQKGIPFTLDIYGGGDQAEELRRKIGKFRLQVQVMMRGTLDFAAELIPRIQEADLFVCPHPQGDPSCTYLETLACGVPIIGYDNAALLGLAERSPAVIKTPMAKPKALADGIAELAGDLNRLADASRAARQFAAQWLFEDTMRARIEHMIRCSRNPDRPIRPAHHPSAL